MIQPKNISPLDAKKCCDQWGSWNFMMILIAAICTIFALLTPSENAPYVCSGAKTVKIMHVKIYEKCVNLNFQSHHL